MGSHDIPVIADAVKAFLSTGTPREAIDLLRTRAAAPGAFACRQTKRR